MHFASLVISIIYISSINKKQKKIPTKTLCYFQLKPQLQRLFLSSKKVNDKRRNAKNTNNDGMLRHPRYLETWNKIFLKHTLFA